MYRWGQQVTQSQVSPQVDLLVDFLAPASEEDSFTGEDMCTNPAWACSLLPPISLLPVCGLLSGMNQGLIRCTLG